MTKENLILNETSLVEAEPAERFGNLKRMWKEKHGTHKNVVLNSSTGAYEVKGAKGTESEHATDNQNLEVIESGSDLKNEVAEAGNAYPVINEVNGSLYVSSRDVAKGLGKRHDHVIRDLDNIFKSDSPDLGNEIIPSTYTNSRGKEYREYLLTKDGFTLYMFNIQGHNNFKIAYINRFNEMEKALHEVVNVANTKANLLLSIYNGGQEGVEASRQLVELEKQPLLDTIAEQAPKVESYDTFIDASHTFGFRELYKEVISATGLKMKENYFKEVLRHKKIIVNTSVDATVEAIRKGYAETKDVKCKNSAKTTTQDRFTIECRDYLVEYFTKEFISPYNEAIDELMSDADKLESDAYEILSELRDLDEIYSDKAEDLFAAFTGDYEDMLEITQLMCICDDELEHYKEKIKVKNEELGKILVKLDIARISFLTDKIDYSKVAELTIESVQETIDKYIVNHLNAAEGYVESNVVKDMMKQHFN